MGMGMSLQEERLERRAVRGQFSAVFAAFNHPN